ncbi:MAG: L-arabinolactonase [Micrococcaceae bacterium]|nr:L-arabinolactonase [Micrococcaceae bacterium]
MRIEKVSQRELEVFRDPGAELVESILWDDGRQELLWTDIPAGTLHRSPADGDRDGTSDTATQLPAPLASFQPRAGGGFVAALADTIVVLDSDGELVRTLARIEHRHDGMRLNEGKCDPYGRFLVGSMDTAEGRSHASLYSVSADGSVSTLRTGLGTTNGIEFAADGRTLYYTDTVTSTVYRCTYAPDGQAGEPTPFLVGHSSDGLAMDVEGRFWNGCYGEGKVVRWTPDGTVDLEIEVPVPNVTSVGFGGPDLGTLFIGTARENLSPKELQEFPLSGAIFAIDTGTAGRPALIFGPATKENAPWT